MKVFDSSSVKIFFYSSVDDLCSSSVKVFHSLSVKIFHSFSADDLCSSSVKVLRSSYVEVFFSSSVEVVCSYYRLPIHFGRYARSILYCIRGDMYSSTL